MAKTNMVTIRCSAGPGFDGKFRAGRKWPASGKVCELVDQDEDREEANGKPLGIGRKTLAALRGDSGFSIDANGALDELETLRAKVAAAGDAPARIAELEKQVADLTAENEQLRAAAAKAGEGESDGKKTKGAKG